MLAFKSKEFSSLRTGLVHSKQTHAAAVVSRRPGAGPRLLHVVAEGRSKGVLAWRATQAMLEKLPHRHAPVAAVLEPADYQLLLTEDIDVPAEELSAAVRWRIREQSSIPIDETVVDTFALPPSRNHEVMLQAVVASAASIDELEAIVSGAARELDVIDIPELALRNLMVLLPQDLAGCAFVLLGRGSISILISCMGVLYVARRIDGAIGMQAEQLALELQRSTQYYESQFDRAPINDIVLGPANAQSRELAPLLTEACGIPCQVLDLPAILSCEDTIGSIEQPEMLVAIGAALRATRHGAAP